MMHYLRHAKPTLTKIHCISITFVPPLHNYIPTPADFSCYSTDVGVTVAVLVLIRSKNTCTWKSENKAKVNRRSRHNLIHLLAPSEENTEADGQKDNRSSAIKMKILS